MPASPTKWESFVKPSLVQPRSINGGSAFIYVEKMKVKEMHAYLH
jgi:hypothetical protein